jgi:FtsP/CotA-like multicopper oxidase with cupredoxin domain
MKIKGDSAMPFTTIKGKAGLLGLLLLTAVLLMVVLTRQGETQTAPAVTIDLWADEGTATMPDGSQVPIWGFTNTQGGQVTLPGPKLEVNQGEVVTVVLHNALDNNRDTSIVFPGQDVTSSTSAGDKTYTFTAGKPGTYVYESGTSPEKQIQMGLYGALVVKTNTPGQAYASPSSAYDREAVMVLSEVDPAFHQNPDAAVPSSYAPKFFLINGKSYPQTDNIPAAAGEKVLFRYLNAGYQNHTLQLLGMGQQTIAGDANLLPAPRGTYTQTVAPGETYDLIGTVPTNTAPGTKFPLYSREMQINNNGTPSTGGMATFVEVP